MNKKLELALSSIGIPYYNTRATGTDNECAIYQISEDEYSYCDDDEDIIEYKILIVLFLKGKLNKRIKTLKANLLKNGFIIDSIPYPNIEGKNGETLISQSIVCKYKDFSDLNTNT